MYACIVCERKFGTRTVARLEDGPSGTKVRKMELEGGSIMQTDNMLAAHAFCGCGRHTGPSKYVLNARHGVNLCHACEEKVNVDPEPNAKFIKALADFVAEHGKHAAFYMAE